MPMRFVGKISYSWNHAPVATCGGEQACMHQMQQKQAPCGLPLACASTQFRPTCPKKSWCSAHRKRSRSTLKAVPVCRAAHHTEGACIGAGTTIHTQQLRGASILSAFACRRHTSVPSWPPCITEPTVSCSIGQADYRRHMQAKCMLVDCQFHAWCRRCTR